MRLPLTIHRLLWRMENVHRDAEVVAVHGSGPDSMSRTCTFADLVSAVCELASVLHVQHGIGPSDTVAVLAFNTVEHVRLLFAVPLLGAAVNSLNIRLTADALVAQAQDHGPALLVVDDEVLQHRTVGVAARAAVARLEAEGVHVRHVDTVSADGLVGTPIGLPVVSEDTTAFLFHTSGTTGPAKTYSVSHRDVVLHALSQATADATGLRSGDRVLPLAPFCHVNGWGLPFTAVLTGASLVLPGGDLTAARIAEILSLEQVTVAAAVPTVWFDV